MAKETGCDRGSLAKLTSRQHSVIARDQAVACGVSEAALRWRLRPEGPWRRMLPGIYLTRTGSPTTEQLYTAALLFAGPGSVITGAAALRFLGAKAHPTSVVDLLVPIARRRQSAGYVKLHRTKRLPDRFYIHGPIRVALVPRAVADAARGLGELREVRAVVADSVQRRWCSVAELAEELRDGPVAGSALLRRALAEVAGGIRSAAEADLLDLIRAGWLPMPMFNARLFAGSALLAVADAWWPEARVVVEVDSREWHLSPGDWEKTLRRHARLSAQGILVLHFTPRQLRAERAQVIATIRAALDAARAGGQPAVRALPAAC